MPSICPRGSVFGGNSTRNRWKTLIADSGGTGALARTIRIGPARRTKKIPSSSGEGAAFNRVRRRDGAGRGTDVSLAERRRVGLRGAGAPLAGPGRALPGAPRRRARPRAGPLPGGVPAPLPGRVALPRERDVLDLALPHRAERRPRRRPPPPPGTAVAGRRADRRRRRRRRRL